MGLTLDDLRQPGFGGRVWGYDRDEVDQLLASVVVSIERLQRRRQRDAEAIERANIEARTATARAERLERERDELATRIELADEAVERAEADAEHRTERRLAEAEERAARAERARRELEAERSADAAALWSGAETAGADDARSGGQGPPLRLPLALRAARVLLAEARARAAAIEAEARAEAGWQSEDPALNLAEDDEADATADDQSNSSGSSATIHS